MFITTDRTIDRDIPHEFNNKERVYNWYVNKTKGIRFSLVLLEKDNDHLKIRTPLTNENTDVYGEPSEIQWLFKEMIINDLFSYK